jgi:hypothetical protein
MMRLVRDVLDKQIVDRHRRPCGKVDGIVLAVGHGAPRVVALEVGAVTLAGRLGPRWGRWARALVTRLGGRVAGEYRIPWRRVAGIGRDVHVDLDSARVRARRAERWLRDHVVAKIPGA